MGWTGQIVLMSRRKGGSIPAGRCLERRPIASYCARREGEFCRGSPAVVTASYITHAHYRLSWTGGQFVDRYPTFCFLAGVDGTDDPPVAPLPVDPANVDKDIYGNESFPPLDGVNIWPMCVMRSAWMCNLVWPVSPLLPTAASRERWRRCRVYRGAPLMLLRDSYWLTEPPAGPTSHGQDYQPHKL